MPPEVDLLHSHVPRQAALPGEERVFVSGRGPDRRPARLRPAHRPVGREFPLQLPRRPQRFAQATQENVGKPFAIVLDNEVITAPVIREPILGGSGQISGNFTVQSANDLAILLRAGALPAPLTIIEERTVGPGLGQDSIEKGKLAVLCRRRHRRHLHARDLRPVRPVRQHRRGDQRRA